MRIWNGFMYDRGCKLQIGKLGKTAISRIQKAQDLVLEVNTEFRDTLFEILQLPTIELQNWMYKAEPNSEFLLAEYNNKKFEFFKIRIVCNY